MDPRITAANAGYFAGTLTIGALVDAVLNAAINPFPPAPPVLPPVVVAPPVTPSTTTLAMARWDTVPLQTVAGQLNVGVVAFASAGITSVTFTVCAGLVPSAAGTFFSVINALTLNPATGAWEYVFAFDATQFPDGPVTLCAAAQSADGSPPRVLAPLILYANSKGTLPAQFLWVAPTGSDTNPGTQAAPFATILAATQAATDGATIYLAAGTYPFGEPVSGENESARWITICPSPGVDRADVVITPGGTELRVYNLHLQNVTIRATVGQDLEPWNYIDGKPTAIWLDGCDVSSPGVTAEIGEIVSSNWTAQYFTNTTIHDYAGSGIVGADLIRGCVLANLGDSAIDNPGLVVNTTIDGIKMLTPDEHIDSIHWFGGYGATGSPDANSIVYGVKATNVGGQLLFDEQTNNIAVVNYFATSTDGAPANPEQAQLDRTAISNVFLCNVTLPNQAFDLDAGVAFTGVTIRSSVFYALLGVPAAGVTVENCWDISAQGDPGFNNAAAGDYRPGAGSPLLKGAATPSVPVDVNGNLRTSPDTIGAFVAA